VKIHLNETELKQAIAQYINNQGIDLTQRKIDIELTAGRGTRGHYADIHLVEQAGEDEDNPFIDTPATDEPGEDEPGIDFS